MKYQPYKSFGYPVLRPAEEDQLENADYVGWNFQVELVSRIPPAAADSVLIEYDLVQIVQALRKAIEEKNAEILLMVSCRETFFTDVFTLSDESGSVKIKADLLHGNTEFSFFIKCVKNFELECEQINEEFGYKKFLAEKGNILAQSYTYRAFIHKEYYRNARSIISISISEDLKDGEYTVSLDTQSQYIEVSTGRALNRKINGMWSSVETKINVLNSFYVPIITQAISQLREKPEEYQDLKWAQIIESQLASVREDTPVRDEPHNEAQALFKSPLSAISEGGS